MRTWIILVLMTIILFTTLSCSNSNSQNIIVSTVQTQEWLTRLNYVLKLENLSVAQYENHAKKFNTHMPYNMIIPQEYNHVSTISNILRKYNIKPTNEYPPIKKAETLKESYTLDMELEQNLFPKYQWLIENSNSPKDKQVLSKILSETMNHYNWFSRAIRMLDMHQQMGPGRMQQHHMR